MHVELNGHAGKSLGPRENCVNTYYEIGRVHIQMPTLPTKAFIVAYAQQASH